MPANTPTPRTATFSFRIANIFSAAAEAIAQTQPNIIVDGLGGVNFDRYALRIKSVFAKALNSQEYYSFDKKNFDREKDSTIEIELSEHPVNPFNKGKKSELEFNFTRIPETGEACIPFIKFFRIIRKALVDDGRGLDFNRGYYGIVIECIPFVTNETFFGQGNRGTIVSVNKVINMFDNPLMQEYIDALYGRMTFLTPPKVLVLPFTTIQKYAAESTKNAFFEHGTATRGIIFPIQKDGHIMNEPSLLFDRSNTFANGILSGHPSFLAELGLHMKELRPFEGATTFTSADGSDNIFGGYWVIGINDINYTMQAHTLLHEVGHAVTPFSITKQNDSGAFLNLPDGVVNESFNIASSLRKWRGFGIGEVASFDRAHASPGGPINFKLHACPVIFRVGGALCPMDSRNIMAYPTTHAYTCGSLYQDASFVGAIISNTEFPLNGQVFLHEAFLSVVDEYASPDKRSVLAGPRTYEDMFTMFKQEVYTNNLGAVMKTKSFFLTMQSLWGGIQARSSIFGSKKGNVNFLDKPQDASKAHDNLVDLFFEREIDYKDFSYTQKQEYEMPYEDTILQSNVKVDYLKRATPHNNQNHEVDANYPQQGLAYSHVHDGIIEEMKFEILKDVIEIINGEPRRTFKDQVAKYDYIISQAKGNTSAELESSFQGEDEKILSIWGGTKVSKKMDVEGECKYVYVVIRIANDLNFQNATVTDDRGREVNIP